MVLGDICNKSSRNRIRKRVVQDTCTIKRRHKTEMIRMMYIIIHPALMMRSCKLYYVKHIPLGVGNLIEQEFK